MIEVNDLRKGFGDKIVIDGVSCKMNAGQCNLIIGASGSGKTVLMKCMVGLFQPDSGDILYNGKNFTQMTIEQKKRNQERNRNALPGICSFQQYDS